MTFRNPFSVKCFYSCEARRIEIEFFLQVANILIVSVWKNEADKTVQIPTWKQLRIMGQGKNVNFSWSGSNQLIGHIFPTVPPVINILHLYQIPRLDNLYILFFQKLWVRSKPQKNYS